MQTRKLACLTYSLLIAVICTSCKKQTSIEDQNIEKNKIFNFIRSSVNQNSTIPLEEISIALSEANLQFEISENSEDKLAVAKLKRPLSIIDEKSDNSLYLIAFYEIGEKIRKVKFVSYDNLGLRTFKDLPQNTLNKIVNIGTNEVDGLFKFYSVEGKLQFQLNYTGGRLGAVGNVTRYPKNITPGTEIVSQSSSSYKQKSNWMYECSDVYLVTSYYDASGNYLYQTREFLYRQGNCSGPGEVQVPQPDEGGGGGFPEEYEYARFREKDWTVGYLPSFLPHNSDGGVVSVENIRGKKVSSEPQGGHFTSIVHNSDGCRCGSVLVWWATQASGSASAQTATATVKGGVSWAGNYYALENSTLWSFNQVFP